MITSVQSAGQNVPQVKVKEANCYCAHRPCKVRVTVEITLPYPPKVAYISTPFELRSLSLSSDLLPTHSTRQPTTIPTMDTAKSDTTITPAPWTSCASSLPLNAVATTMTRATAPPLTRRKTSRYTNYSASPSPVSSHAPVQTSSVASSSLPMRHFHASSGSITALPRIVRRSCPMKSLEN